MGDHPLPDVLTTVFQAIWLMAPAYVANMGAVVVGGGAPIDGGRRWRDGRDILGPGKTWRGLLLAPLLACLVAALGWWADPRTAWAVIVPFGPWPEALAYAYAMGFGALVGDSAKSFFKRRRGVARGEMWLGPDQLDFVFGGLLFAWLAGWALYGPAWFPDTYTLPILLVVVVLTPGLHLAVNVIGYKLKLKKVPY